MIAIDIIPVLISLTYRHFYSTILLIFLQRPSCETSISEQGYTLNIVLCLLSLKVIQTFFEFVEILVNRGK